MQKNIYIFFHYYNILAIVPFGGHKVVINLGIIQRISNYLVYRNRLFPFRCPYLVFFKFSAADLLLMLNLLRRRLHPLGQVLELTITISPNPGTNDFILILRVILSVER